MLRRRCSVFECNNAKNITRCYMFPEQRPLGLLWRKSLELHDFTLNELQTNKFSVCFNHFIVDDFDKNGQLKSNAIPKKLLTDNELQILGPTAANIKKLMLEVPLNLHNLELQNSTASTTTDICVLEKHFGEDGEEEFYESAVEVQDMTDFALLAENNAEKSYKKRSSKSCIEESTEVLMLLNSEYAHQSVGTRNLSQGGTDSDVEILMSEEVELDSDWSASEASAAFEDFDIDPPAVNTQFADVGNEMRLILKNEMQTPQEQPQASTEQDISVEEFSSSSAVIEEDHSSSCDINNDDSLSQLSRSQLLQVIRDQGVRIRQLETTLQRYRDAQQTLFAQVDALRMELQMERDESHETIYYK